MFGLMRKLISKPFADTHEKREQMDRLVCNMVNDPEFVFKPRLPSNEKFNDKVAELVGRAHAPITIKSKVDYGYWPPIDDIGVEKPVWRPHNGRDLPADAVKVFEFGKVAQAVGVYQGWHSVKYSEDGHIFDTQDSAVEFVFCGEYAIRIECQECEGGGLEIQSKTNRHSDYGWVRVEATYTGAKCPHCKGKGYTLERFKR